MKVFEEVDLKENKPPSPLVEIFEMLLPDTETVVDSPSNLMKPPDEDNEVDVV